MDLQDLMSRFAVALGIGLVFGLERTWRTRDASPGSRTAGIRTFALSGLLGGVIGALAIPTGGAASPGGGLVVGLGFAAFAAAMALFFFAENRADQTFSATSFVTAIVTFALGVYALLGEIRVAAAVAVVGAGILAARESLHGWIKHLTWPELRSALVLLAMTFVALPLVPNEDIGPFGGVNPREVWIIAIALAAISFLGYAAVKFFGDRWGLLLAGAAGGLVSSTAVTIANARRAATQEGPTYLFSAGVALATAVKFLRIGGIVGVLKPGLLVMVAPALLAATVTAVGFAVVAAFWLGAGSRSSQRIKFRNPFDLRTVIGFAFLLAVFIVVGRTLGEAFGATTAIAGAAVMGLVDVDATTIATVRLTPKPLDALSAGLAIVAAVATDTVSKIAIGAALGHGRFAVEISLMALGCFIAGGAALWATVMLVAA